MSLHDLPPNRYAQEYRKRLGFTNQSAAKVFLGAKDIRPSIDYQYIDQLLSRISDIVHKLNSIITTVPKPDDIDYFLESFVYQPYDSIRKHG